MVRQELLPARVPTVANEGPICRSTPPSEMDVATPGLAETPSPNRIDLTAEDQLRERRSWLSNVDVIDMEPEECLLFVFEDSGKERQYSEYIARTRTKLNDIIGLSISSGLAVAFSARSTFETLPAQVLRALVVLAVAANAAWLSVVLFSPSFATKYRSPLVFILSWFVHFVVGCLPPLTYQSYSAPSTAFGAYMLIMANSRFTQCLFAMGPWSTTGFFADLILLTVILCITVHWNEQECKMLCHLQPALAARYSALGSLLGLQPSAGAGAEFPVAACLAVRKILQATLGCLLPIGLGLYREITTRRSFATEYRIRVRRTGFKDAITQFGMANSLFMATVGITITMLAFVPQLEYLPTLLRKGDLKMQGY